MDSGYVLNGRYRLRERLGQGGMSVVWRAEDDVLGREVAVKVLSTRVTDDSNLLHQLRAEARAAAGLRHATIVEVYDYGESLCQGETLPYVVMELVDGRTLADLLTGGSVPWRLAVLVSAQVAAALAAAHAQGVVHRDVKPGNVMVTSSGVKLVDFGISAAVGAMDGADGQLFGTPAYLAPERIAGGPVRPATDVYALGLVLYRSLAGRMPWQASTTTQMLKAHYYTDPAPLPPVPGLPREVAVLVRRCLAKQPGDRPTAHQVAEVLGDLAGLPPATLLHNAAAPGAPAVRGSERGRRRTLGVGAARKYLSGRRRSAVAAGAATAVMATGLAIWAMDEPRNGSPAVAAIPVAACAVRYASSATPNGGTTTTITISNTGPVQMHPWRLAVALPDGRRLVRGWSAAWQQQGDVIYADGPSLPVGGLLTTGFETSKSRSTSRPMAFTVNDTPCHADSVRQPAIASPPPTTRIPVGQTTTVTKPKPSPPAKSKPATRKSASVEPKSKATTKNPTSVKPKGENKGKDKGKGENKSKGKGKDKDKDKDKRKDHGKSQKKGKQKAKGKGAKSSTSTA